eukprot:1714887-Pyramimonas_sp.AAC.1
MALFSTSISSSTKPQNKVTAWKELAAATCLPQPHSQSEFRLRNDQRTIHSGVAPKSIASNDGFPVSTSIVLGVVLRLSSHWAGRSDKYSSLFGARDDEVWFESRGGRQCT